MKRSKLRSLLSLLLCAVLLSGCAALPVPEQHKNDSGTAAELSEETETEPVRTVPPYPDIRVYCDGILTDRGYIRDGNVYISFDPFCSALGMSPVTEFDGAEFTMSCAMVELQAEAGKEYMTVNGRYVFTPGSFFTVGNEAYFPVSAAEYVFGTKITVAEDMSRVDLSADGLSVLSGGEHYYTLTYDSEDVFWLSRIIYAEATYQPLEGRIAVGNVVLNRVDCEDYPDNIYDVIFDDFGSVQFDPARDGTVFNKSDELSMVATYLALDGVNVVDDCMYFVNPDLGIDTWFRETLEFYRTIADHDFYHRRKVPQEDGA